ncbi:putative SWEET sugar transporter [Helianthus annuus]|uniref:Bidirectional sugar transporter SWEET n=1 Tax=Helianthus annuus TaxID=4232 RepID=A0A251RWS1_HELAN|nr:bidirectional sugar transporter SWEET5 [Helianthus annuus]KAF5758569.1 putative SWEET sugar transporter [Helianthus annuus]KAJ0436889.1 putative SWEET sugar transporter [Helianthus annuus]KAJ0441168.1 putative SWEET sugar transporter [Helianthus annuus]KAJ0459201.1 putative SWEET sugar transporter [Helianthus annuus]KAJ0639757.1 putative SWEET sugar transporter [Helianthus annuus]
MDMDTARTLVGVLGNIISLILFLSPLPTFIKIIQAKSVQAFKPDPYVATILNCAVWMFYGLPIVHPDSLLVVTINGAGLAIETVFIIIFFIYSTWGGRRKILIILFCEAVFVALVVVATLMCFDTYKDRSMVVGLIAIVFNILMYAAPLTVMRMVIKTRSVKYMPFSLSLASFVNSIVWCVYALMPLDPYILVPNGLGSLSAIVQLILYATYYGTTNWDDDDDEKYDLQMSSTSKA